SPPGSPLPFLENESTSVGLSFPRKSRFNRRSRRSPAMRISISPAARASFPARRAKRSSAGRLTSSIVVSKVITSLTSQLAKNGQAGSPGKQIRRATFALLPRILLFLLLQRRLLFAAFARLLREIQRHLLVARALVIGVDDTLHQV